MNLLCFCLCGQCLSLFSFDQTLHTLACSNFGQDGINLGINSFIHGLHLIQQVFILDKSARNGVSLNRDLFCLEHQIRRDVGAVAESEDMRNEIAIHFPVNLLQNGVIFRFDELCSRTRGQFSLLDPLDTGQKSFAGLRHLFLKVSHDASKFGVLLFKQLSLFLLGKF